MADWFFSNKNLGKHVDGIDRVTAAQHNRLVQHVFSYAITAPVQLLGVLTSFERVLFVHLIDAWKSNQNLDGS